MKVVNKSNIPDLFYTYFKNDFYDFKPSKNSISATGLLKSVRETILTQRHNDEIEIDAISRLWSLFGTGIHMVLEKGNLSKSQEERIQVAFKDWIISMKFDIIHDGFIKDFKCTSAYTLIYKDRVEEWAKQMSIYRWGYWRKHGKELPDKGYIMAILRDWASREVNRVKNYPDCALKEIELKLLTFEEVETFIAEVIDKFNACDKLEDSELPECSELENWKGKKCADYCSCNTFCNQYKEMLKLKKGDK